MLPHCVTFCWLTVLYITLVSHKHGLALAQEDKSLQESRNSVKYRSLASHYLHELIRNAQDELAHLTIHERSGSERQGSKVRNRSPTRSPRRGWTSRCFPMCTSRQTCDDIELANLENILRATELKSSNTAPKSVRFTAEMHQVQITDTAQFLYKFFKQEVKKTYHGLLRGWALQLGELISVEEEMRAPNGGKLYYVADNPEWGNVTRMRLNFKVSLHCYVPRAPLDPTSFRMCFPTLKGDYICGIEVYYASGDAQRPANVVYAKNTLKCEPATATKATQSPRPRVSILKKVTKNFSV